MARDTIDRPADRTSGGYPAPLLAEVRELDAAGWAPSEIRAILARRGHERIPSPTTIYLWTRSDYRERHSAACRARSAQRNASAATFRLRSSTPAYQAAFAVALRDAGVKAPAIARVFGVIYGDGWTPYRIKRLLTEASA